MNVRMATLVVLLCASVNCAFAEIADVRIKEYLDLNVALFDLKDANEQTGNGLDRIAQLGPGVEPRVEQLEARAMAFHAPNFPFRPPKLDGDRVFSPDVNTRKATAEEW